MRVYVFGPNSLAHYDFPHSEVVAGLGAGLGLAAAGLDVTVLWGGHTDVVRGIHHEHLDAARPTPDDVLLCMHPTWAQWLWTLDRFTALRVPRERWLYTNSFYTQTDVSSGPLCFRDVWEPFDPIFVESPLAVARIRQEFPRKRVEWVMLGCVHDVDLVSLCDPYPPYGRHLFFAGRIPPSQRMRALLDALPPDFHLWCVSQEEPTEECTSHARFHALGAQPFGSFWQYHHFAWASLDFGFTPLSAPIAINCKVLDALRAGSRVAADGQSPSHFLIGQYQAGGIVPFGDADALAALILSLPAESRGERLARAARFAAGESWHARARLMLRYLRG